jgi:lysophospholipase L1-like esterase
MTLVALIGDSHMQALGPRIKTQLALEGVESTVVANAGKSLGWYLSTGELSRAAAGATHVVFEIGGNDDWRASPIDDVRTAIQNALGIIEPRRSLWVGPATARADGADDARARHEDTAEKYGMLLGGRVEWLDSRGVTRTGQREDGVHFTPEAYDAWAAVITKRALRLVRGPSFLELLLAALGFA